jgi:hypothetical protein
MEGVPLVDKRTIDRPMPRKVNGLRELMRIYTYLMGYKVGVPSEPIGNPTSKPTRGKSLSSFS